MRLPDEQDERGMGMPVVYTIVAVSVFILIVLAAVFMSNTRQGGSGSAKNRALSESPSPSPEEEMEFAEGQKDIEALYKEHRLRAEDLDFWDMYKDDEIVVREHSDAGPDANESPGASLNGSPGASASPSPSLEPSDEELAADGKHVKITRKDGTEEWMEISEDIPLSTCDFTNIKISDGKMTYYQDGEKNSWLGVDLSKNSGQVDFEALKDSGVDFVMLRLGSRGYETGLISLDENFVNNITKAQDVGLEVGVYFYSQAVTEREAIEEAEFVINNLIAYPIKYPVAFNMDSIVNDKARTDILREEDKTQIAEEFMSRLELEGYRPILYGTKNWLLGELLPDKLLEDYDVWLNDQSAIPDYPYQFKMWRYAAPQKISGVENDAAYIISFVDYTRK